MADVDEVVRDLRLQHHGVKGMKWGRRKSESTPVPVSTHNVTKGDKIKVKAAGGTKQQPHKDAVNAAKTKQILKKSGSDALSNKELRDLKQRIELEKQVKQLAQPPNPAKKFIKNLLGNTGKQQSQNVANDLAAQQIKQMMAKK